MAVTIRLSRRGTAKKPFYRIIASHKGSKRDSSFIEILGTYNPLTNPPTVAVKEDRMKHWVSVGAMPSETVASIIKTHIPNFLEARAENKLKKVRAARKARKARLAAKGGAKKAKKESKKATKK